jgi:large subunit ribosomal protein L9
VKAKLEGTPIRITVKAGREGRLFGSVKTADIADAAAAAGLGTIDKRTIELGSAVKSTGRYDATVRLREDVVAALTIEVVAAK